MIAINELQRLQINFKGLLICKIEINVSMVDAGKNVSDCCNNKNSLVAIFDQKWKFSNYWSLINYLCGAKLIKKYNDFVIFNNGKHYWQQWKVLWTTMTCIVGEIEKFWLFQNLIVANNADVFPLLSLVGVGDSDIWPCWRCWWWSSWCPAGWDRTSGRGRRRTWGILRLPSGRPFRSGSCAWCHQSCSPDSDTTVKNISI